MGYKIGLAEKRKKLLEEELKNIIPKIIQIGVEKIILFGSLASDRVHKRSDIDIIVVRETNQRFLDRLEEIYLHLKPRLGIDILVYTPQEIEEMKENNQFLKSALKKGRVIYEK